MLTSLALTVVASSLPMPVALRSAPRSTTQAAQVRIAIARGDAMPDGGRVEFLDDWAINDAGQLLIVARSINQVSRLILNEQLLFRLGDPIEAGVTFVYTRGIDIRNGGDWVASVETSQGSALLLNGNVVARAGDILSTVNLPGVPAAAELLAFGDNPQWSNDVLTIAADVGPAGSVPPSTYRLIYRLDPAAGTLVLERGTRVGDVMTIDGDLLRRNFSTFVDADGTISELSSVITAGDAESSVVSVGGVVMVREGDAAPVPGQTLFLTPVAHASFASRGAFGLEATHRLFPGGPLKYHLFKNGVNVISGGDLAPDGSGFPILDNSFGVQLASDGTMFYDVIYPIGSTSTFGYLIVRENEVVLSSAWNVLPNGDPLPHLSMPKAVDGLSPDGSLLAFATGTISGVGPAIGILELEPGRPTSCQANPNSTGSPGQLDGAGSAYLDGGGLRLIASDLPAASFGQLLISRNSGFVPMSGGSSGSLCLASPIGRSLPANPSSGSTGTIEASIDLTALPQPSGTISANIGETWFFQIWHRDAGPAGSTSNFTRSYEVQVR